MAKTCTISLLSAATAMTMCLSSPPAMAEDTGFYVSANVGRLLSTYRRSDLDNEVVAAFGGANSGFSFGSSSLHRYEVRQAIEVIDRSPGGRRNGRYRLEPLRIAT